MGDATTGQPDARFSRRVRSVVANTLLVSFLAALLWVFWPASLGGFSTFTIVSGHSMEPTYYTGDLVWARSGEYEVGDVVVYQPLSETNAQVIHRIIGGSSAEGWSIQGDNNDFIDPWEPTDEQVLGKAMVHLPNLGSAIHFLASPFVWLSALVIGGGLLLWPNKPNTPATDDADASTEDVEVSDASAQQDDNLIFPSSQGE